MVSNITTLQVSLAQRSYPIYVGEGLLQQAKYLLSHIRGEQVAIITNATIAPLYLSKVQKLLSDYQCDVVILPDGEEYKTWEQLSQIFDILIEKHHDRNTTLIALGGGVVGDMTGFAAAVYLRGVNFIQIPTSLLAQVDAAVGGKTAVNHPLGKNLLGAFYQPQCVVIDPNVLLTLLDRELSAGLAEVIKHALLADAEFFAWLENNIQKLLSRDMSALQYAITRCCQIKAHIVEQDECEKNIRAWLNLGHTFAHAIEQLTHYQILHGEAVAIGLVAMAKLSQELGGLPADRVARISRLLQNANLPITAPHFPVEDYLQCMQLDKKNTQGQLTFVLLHNIAQPYICNTVPQTLMLEVLRNI